MHCPKCREKKDLKRVKESGVELDYCTECGGIWFDAGELKKVVEERIDLRFDAVKTKETPMMTDYKTAVCPVCGKPMAKDTGTGVAGLTVDRCGACGGVWLDGGEFKRIKNASLLASLKDLKL